METHFTNIGIKIVRKNQNIKIDHIFLLYLLLFYFVGSNDFSLSTPNFLFFFQDFQFFHSNYELAYFQLIQLAHSQHYQSLYVNYVYADIFYVSNQWSDYIEIER